MYPERVQDHSPVVLTKEQREFYFENGYVLLESVVPMETIERLREVTEAMVERSRSVSQSDAIFDLEPGHSADTPRLRRLSSPVAQDPLYWEFASISPITEDDGQITHFVAVKENITERKQAEEELARLNQELVDTSRQAGMAEVASGVLHNVGNVLNSVTTSAGEVARRVKALPVDDLNSVAQLVKQQGDRTAEFFANDERGAMIPDFLVQVGSLLTDEQEAVTWTTNLPIDAYC